MDLVRAFHLHCSARSGPTPVRSNPVEMTDYMDFILYMFAAGLLAVGITLLVHLVRACRRNRLQDGQPSRVTRKDKRSVALSLLPPEAAHYVWDRV